MKKKILIVISQGIVVRNLFQTEFIDYVFNPKDFCVTVVTSKNLESKIVNLNSIRLKKVPFYLSAFSKIMRQRFYAINPNKSLEIFESQPLFPSWRSRLRWALKLPFPKSKFIYYFLLLLLKKLCVSWAQVDRDFNKFISGHDLVILTNPIDFQESIYVVAAQMHNIPTVSFVKSFDNLTTKGFMPFLSEYIFVWNYKMFLEAISIFNFSPSRVTVVGAPHFNFSESPKIDARKQKNINILYASVAEALNPSDPEIVTQLRRNLTPNNKITVRLHQNDRMPRWGSLQNVENVEIFNPSHSENSQIRVSADNTLLSLHKQILNSSIVVNTASTMTLEALSFKKPVINVAFSFDPRVDVSRYYELDHYKYLERSKNVYFCYSLQEVLEAIEVISRVGWLTDDDFNSFVLGPKDTQAICRDQISKILNSNHKL